MLAARSSLLWLLLAGTAYAGSCDKLEFAELDSMAREDLLRIRCEYVATMNDPRLLREGGRYGLALANRCAEESARMDRILARKYKLKDPGDQRAPYFIEINGMCQR